MWSRASDDEDEEEEEAVGWSYLELTRWEDEAALVDEVAVDWDYDDVASCVFCWLDDWAMRRQHSDARLLQLETRWL